jgi:hypothetical protein
MNRSAPIAVVLLSILGCQGKAINETPEGAVREIVVQMRLMGRDEGAAKRAFDLLSRNAQQNLSERAERYGAGSGKHIAPEAMLAPFSLVEHFEGREFSSETVGIHALVHVRGLLAEESATIPCIFEEGGWRVDIALPPLPVVRVESRTGR